MSIIAWFQFHSSLLLTIFFGFISFVILLYYFLLYAHFAFRKTKRVNNPFSEPVSIVISAKNEAHHLIKTLPLFLQQDYHQYEVVVVNDNSTDETVDVIRDFMTQYSHLKLVNLISSVTNIQGKKFPLSIGIKSASYDLLLLTDADAIPSSKQWLQKMARHFKGKTEVVLGYSTFEKRSGFLNRLIHFDTMQTAMQYFSYALVGIPYMGNGKNLAYTKPLFMQKKGFASLNHLRYADDDLFVAKIANRQNCAIEYDKDAHTFSHSRQRLRDWIRLKRRYSVSFKQYKSKHKFLLNIYEFGRICSWNGADLHIVEDAGIESQGYEAQGVNIDKKIVYCRDIDLSHAPVVTEDVDFDGEIWYVTDVQSPFGYLKITMERRVS